jgi:hypothetical protein
MTLKTVITNIGQEYVDEPVYVHAKTERDVFSHLSPELQAAIRPLAQGFLKKGVSAPLVYANIEAEILRTLRSVLSEPAPKPPILIRHDRVSLKWMKPDGKGGLVPRE